MKNTITLKGKPLILQGRTIQPGRPAPGFTLTDRDLNDVHLARFEGKVKILTSFLSLDTPVCEMQVEEFNKKATQLSEDVVIIAISKDLPFAQARFCAAHNIKNIEVLSDYRVSSFGLNYGLQIAKLNLLARSIIIVDKNDILRYVQIVSEATNPPDYDAALKTLEKNLGEPDNHKNNRDTKHCVPCEAGTPPLSAQEIQNRIAELKGWDLIDSVKIVKSFRLKNFTETKGLVDMLALLAEEEGHHPGLSWNYNVLKVTLSTHASGGITENDIVLASLIDECAPSYAAA